jgi:Ca2+-binding RTX toxin-like protein
VRAIVFSGGEGDDAFRNDTSTPSDLFGQLGNDRLSGGSGNDVIRGASGTDFAFGLGGFDSCIAENESGCEA